MSLCFHDFNNFLNHDHDKKQGLNRPCFKLKNESARTLRQFSLAFDHFLLTLFKQLCINRSRRQQRRNGRRLSGFRRYFWSLLTFGHTAIGIKEIIRYPTACRLLRWRWGNRQNFALIDDHDRFLKLP
jgi:hypothetical protein